CVEVEGALYAFPKIDIPKSAVEEAKRRGIKPDTMYAMSLLESEGICTEAGSGFGQEEGTYHIRTTILPQESDFAEVCERFKRHHLKFIETDWNKGVK
ncbi:MAG: Alanine aminotransferase, partial [Streblomastix strix]